MDCILFLSKLHNVSELGFLDYILMLFLFKHWKEAVICVDVIFSEEDV